MLAFGCIVVATDFSETSAHAVELATELAKQYGSKLVIAHCFEVPSYVYAGMMQAPVDLLGPIEQAARSQMHDLLVETKKKHANVIGEVRSGIPADEIIAFSEENKADLVVVGTHGRQGVSHLVLGSVAEKVVRSSKVPVVTVPNKHR